MNIRLIVFLVSLLLLAPVLASADDFDGEFKPLNHKFQVYLGGFFPSIDSKIAINGEVLPEQPEVSFEDVLGLEDSKTLLWGGARWRISRRNTLEFEFAELKRDGSVSGDLTVDIIDDIIIGGSARIDSTFDVTLGRLTYGFSLARNERMDIQLKAGLHIADVSASLLFSGAVCEADPVTATCDPDAGPAVGVAAPLLEDEDITAPLPHFGGSFVYGITPSVAARLQIIGFAIELDSIDGSLVELDADLVWQPWEHVGFGAGLRYFEADIEGKGNELNGSFNFQYFGPVVYAIASF